MSNKNRFGKQVFQINNAGFELLALDLFDWQYRNNPIYRAYTDLTKSDPGNADRLDQIPFLPVSFFKTHQVTSGHFIPGIVFESSGTGSGGTSRHILSNPVHYRESFQRSFALFYGDLREYTILALLPSYLERRHSSLVYMVDDLVRGSGQAESGFFLQDHKRLFDLLNGLEGAGRKSFLLGVTFALLDFAEKYPMKLKNTIVMETGGMKGRRKEITRLEVHEILKERLGVESIHSEYGMTELLSQAYSTGRGIFRSPPWMRVLVREIDDPFSWAPEGIPGILHVIDLANIDSCAFIATEDTGVIHPGGEFEVTGRLDQSAWRGCSLMTA
ncbi:MAG TPA: hypothetical protein VNE41_12790 [Chitinophagaceae bacterium]|nr:hypothetical protein [Chitinophagaceae bacterium]